jgi:hypothetical protein
MFARPNLGGHHSQARKEGALFLIFGFLWPCALLAAATNNLDQEQLAYNLKTTVAAYEKIGRKNPRWDGNAERALTTFAQVRSSTNRAISELTEELRRTLPPLDEEKCDDPLIRYLFTRFVFADAHSTSETAHALEAVAASMQESQYPDIRKFYATMWAYRLVQQAQPQRQETTNLLGKATSYLAAALKEEAMPAREADEGCDFLMSTPWWAEPTRWNCYRTLESALTNRFKNTSLALLAKGRAYLSYAWEARGIGYADTVADKGWQLMSERLNVAADALEAAWKLDPHDTRICREMMRVELGQGKGRDRLETWFQRGMQLDPGNSDLCNEKLEYLRPRWYGSIEAMIRFGWNARPTLSGVVRCV